MSPSAWANRVPHTATASLSHQVTLASERPAAAQAGLRGWHAGLSHFFCLINSRVTPQPSWTPAISLAAINGYLAEAIEHYGTREEVLWLQRACMLCSTMSLPGFTSQLFVLCEANCREEKYIHLLRCWVMPNQHSPHRALFYFFFF